MPIQLIDNASGQPVDVADSYVSNAVQSGKYSFQPGTKIPMAHPETGEVVTVPADKVAQVFGMGWGMATPQQVSDDSNKQIEASRQQFLESQGPTAAAMSFADTRAFGIPSALVAGAQELGLVNPGTTDLIRQVKEANPGWTTAGELAGFAGPGLVGAGLSKMGAEGLGKVVGSAGAPEVIGESVKAVGQRIADRAAAKALAEGYAQKAPGLLQKALSSGVGSAVENALLMGTNTISEQALGDPRDVSENLLSNMELGALVGGGLGFAMPVAGAGAKALAGLVGKGVGKASDAVRDLAFKFQGETGQQAAELLPRLDKTEALQQAMPEALKEAKAGIGEVSSEGRAAVKEVKGDVKDTLDQANRESRQEINDALSGSTEAQKQVKERIGQFAKKGVQNANDALKASVEDIAQIRPAAQQYGNDVVNANFDTAIDSLTGGVNKNVTGSISEKAAGAIEKARALNTPEANAFADKLEKYITEDMWGSTPQELEASKFARSTGQFDAKQDVLTAYKMRQEFGKDWAAMKRGDVKDLAYGLYHDARNEILDHSDLVKNAFETSDGYWRNYYAWADKARVNLETRIAKGTLTPDVTKALGRLNKSPQMEQSILSTLSDFSEHYPEAKDILANHAAVRSAEANAGQTYSDFKDVVSNIKAGKAGPDDLVNFAHSIMPGEDLTSQESAIKIGKIYKDAVKDLGPNASNWEIARAVKDKLGTEGGPALKKLSTIIDSGIQDPKALMTRVMKNEADIGELQSLLKAQGASDRTVSQLNRLDAMKALEETGQELGPQANSVDILARLNQKLGRTNAPLMDELSKASKDIKVLQDLQQLHKENMANSHTGALGMGGMLAGMALGHGPFGVALAGGIKAAKTLSDPIATINLFRTLDKVGSFARYATNKAVDTVVKSLTSPGGVQAVTRTYDNYSIKDRRAAYVKQQQQMRNVGAQVTTLKNNIASQLGPHAPQVAQELTRGVDKFTQFLQSKMPQDPLADKMMFANKSGYVPSDAELHKWNLYLQAANNPSVVFDHLAQGRAIPEEMETLQTLYPQKYNQLRSALLSATIEKQADLSYPQRLLYSQILGTPVDYSLSSGFLSEMQGNFAQANNGEQGGRPRLSETGTQRLANAVMPQTSTDRIGNKVRKG